MRSPRPALAPALAAAAALAFAPDARAQDCVPRPTDPGGDGGVAYGDAPVAPFGGGRVLVWYALAGPHAPDLTSAEGPGGVPDNVARAAAVGDDALARFEALGFRSPPDDGDAAACPSNGGDARLDVYLVDFGSGADGSAVAERCVERGAAARCSTFLLVESSLETRSYGSFDLGVRTVLPHELFHAVQNGYDAALDHYWSEGTAQWAADALDPSLGDLESFLPAFFDVPTYPLGLPGGGAVAAYLYGSAAWPVFLARRHGPAVVRDALERQAQTGGPAATAVGAALAARGSSLADEFPRFAAWNAATGARAGEGGYPDAALYPEVPVATLAARAPTAGVLAGLSAAYFAFRADAPRRLSFEADPARLAAHFVPLEGGRARLDAARALPVESAGDGVVVVAGKSPLLTDATFLIFNELAPTPTPMSPSPSPPSLPPPPAPPAASTPPPPAATAPARADRDDGCSLAQTAPGGRAGGAGGPAALLLAAGLLARASSARPARRATPPPRPARCLRAFRAFRAAGASPRCAARARGAIALVAAALAFAAAGCERPGRGAPARADVERLVTVGGAVTETVAALGAADHIVGVDTSSTYPDSVKTLPQVGYQRALAAEGVVALRPTLVIAAAEAGPPAALEQIRAAGVRLEVVPSELSAEGAKNKVRLIARLLGREAAAEPLAEAIDRDVRAAAEIVAAAKARPRAMPLLARGGAGTFVSGRGTAADAMVRLAGAENAAAAVEGNKPLTAEAAVAAAPEVLVAPTAALAGAGGVDGLLELPGLDQTPAGRARRVIVVDDLMLLGFGPRTGRAALELARQLHPAPGGGAP